MIHTPLIIFPSFKTAFAIEKKHSQQEVIRLKHFTQLIFLSKLPQIPHFTYKSLFPSPRIPLNLPRKHPGTLGGTKQNSWAKSWLNQHVSMVGLDLLGFCNYRYKRDTGRVRPYQIGHWIAKEKSSSKKTFVSGKMKASPMSKENELAVCLFFFSVPVGLDKAHF